MPAQLNNKRIAFLATNGFEDSELERPWNDIQAAGADVDLISLKEGDIKGKNGKTFSVNKTVDAVSAADYDGLVLPGGVANPDHLRVNDKAVSFVRDFFQQKKPVAAICHGPWLLAEADVLKGRTVTSYPSIKTDLKNAGANWVDEEVHVDQGLVTSRKPNDLDAFCKKAIEEFAEGKHMKQAA